MDVLQEWKDKVKIDLHRHFGKPIENSNLYWCLVYDLLFSQILVMPLFSMTWRGTWTVLDYVFDILVFKGHYQASGIFSLALGILGSMPYMLFHRVVQDFAKNGSTFRYLVVSRVFTVTNFYFDLFLWKGLWGLFNHVIGPSWQISASVLGVSLGILLLSQYALKVLGPPVRFSIDRSQDYFHMSTVLSTSPSDPMWKRVMDVLLTILVAILAILTFYGLWSLADMYYDDVNEPIPVQGRHYWHSLGYGYIGVFLAFILQHLCLLSHSGSMEVNPNDNSLLNRVCYGCVLIIAIWGDVLVFRSIYCLFDLYFIPSNPLLSVFLCQFGGLVLMMFFYVSSNLHGGLSSEKYRQANGILFGNFYLTYLLSKRSDQQLLAPNSPSQSSSSSTTSDSSNINRAYED
ncbi:uncharacterized protein LOC131882373 isoform X2 [Tigriopus californicus]|nr:uncharacterized protein LOC131882373 isoform X2 [Tigriopus californicus]